MLKYIIGLVVFVVASPILIAWFCGPFMLVWCSGVNVIFGHHICGPLW